MRLVFSSIDWWAQEEKGAGDAPAWERAGAGAGAGSGGGGRSQAAQEVLEAAVAVFDDMTEVPFL